MRRSIPTQASAACTRHETQVVTRSSPLSASDTADHKITPQPPALAQCTTVKHDSLLLLRTRRTQLPDPQRTRGRPSSRGVGSCAAGTSGDAMLSCLMCLRDDLESSTVASDARALFTICSHHTQHTTHHTMPVAGDDAHRRSRWMCRVPKPQATVWNLRSGPPPSRIT
jgi:hypothetical protein